MLYTPLTCKALSLAYRAHHGQLDPCGVPYVFHPFHLAEQMEDELTTCAALLHDVVEDTSVTFEELAAQFPPEVVDTLRCLTHGEDEDYESYLLRVKANPVALKVKLADLAHNMDESRHCTGNIPEERIIRWREKYKRAMAVLGKQC